MKKPIRKPTKVSLKAPKDWPSAQILKEAEKQMKHGLATHLLSKNAGPVEKIKYELCSHFISYHQKEGISQKELARRLNITESRVSEILHYHHKQFTIDRLLDLLHRLNPKITVKVA